MINEIPFYTDQRGRTFLAAQGSRRYTYQNFDWVPYFEFDATLRFEGTSHTRGGVRFNFISDGPQLARYSLAFTSGEFAKVLAKNTINCGVVTGRWGFCKKGSTYSLKQVL